MSSSKKSSGRKPGLFSSFTGIFCGCNADNREEMEFSGNKTRAMSSSFSTQSTKTPTKLFKNEPEDILQTQHMHYKPSLLSKPPIWLPQSEYEISQFKKSANIYSWGRYHIFQGIGKQANERGIVFIEPELQTEESDSTDGLTNQKVSIRFNSVSRISGFGIGIHGITSKNSFSLGSIAKRKNIWIQNNLLNPDSSSTKSAIENEFHQGGYYILNDSTTDKTILISGECADTIPLTWKPKDQIILEFIPGKDPKLTITVINISTFESKSHTINLDLKSLQNAALSPFYAKEESALKKTYSTLCSGFSEEHKNPTSLFFALILDETNDSAEILGDPDQNNIREKIPPTLQNIQLHDISQKYFLEASSCSKMITFENYSIDCVVISGSSTSERHSFAYFKPSLPFPNEKIYIKRVAFLIDDIGEGELYIGLTREAYAINNVYMDSVKPEHEWHGRKFIFKSSGKQTESNQIVCSSGSIGSGTFASFAAGSILILEYNPFLDQVTMINSQNHKSVLTGVYRDFSPTEFDDKSNRYCFCVGGAKNFKVSLFNDYYDDIDDPKSI